MEPAVEDEDRSLAVEEVPDRAALKRELLVSEKADDGGEVEPPLEPGLDLVHAAALDVEGVPAREDTQVIVHRLDDHARPVPGRDDRPLVVERHDGQEHGGDGDGGKEGTAAAAPQ